MVTGSCFHLLQVPMNNFTSDHKKILPLRFNNIKITNLSSIVFKRLPESICQHGTWNGTYFGKQVH